MLQIPFSEVEIGEYFKHKQVVCERIKDTIRSYQHPFHVNAKQVVPYVSGKINCRGYIALDTLVEVYTTEDELPNVYRSDIKPRTVISTNIEDDGSE